MRHPCPAKSTVTAEGVEGSICQFASLTLKYSNITQPAGDKYGASQKAVVLNGEIVKGKIVPSRHRYADYRQCNQGKHLHALRREAQRRGERLAEGCVYCEWKESGEVSNLVMSGC